MLGPLFLTGTVVGIPLGFLAGTIFTRKLMAPDYCPRCLQQKEWMKDLKDGDKRSDEEKSQSRHFYHLRRKR